MSSPLIELPSQAATVEQLSKEVQSNLQSFWSSNAAAGQPRLHALTQALVQTYFPLTARELDEWETDSEAFFHSLEGGSWQDHLRLCAENLCLTLLRVSVLVVCQLCFVGVGCATSNVQQHVAHTLCSSCHSEQHLVLWL